MSTDMTKWLEEYRIEFIAKRENILSTNMRVCYIWTDGEITGREPLQNEVLPTPMSWDESDTIESFCDDLDDVHEYNGEIDIFAVRYLCEIPREYKVTVEYHPSFSVSRKKESA